MKLHVILNAIPNPSGIMPMNRNVKANRMSEDWTFTFLQSALKFSCAPLCLLRALGVTNPTS